MIFANGKESFICFLIPNNEFDWEGNKIVSSSYVTQGWGMIVLKVMINDFVLCGFEYASLRGKQEMVVICSYHIEKGTAFFDIESASFFFLFCNIKYLELTSSLEQE